MRNDNQPGSGPGTGTGTGGPDSGGPDLGGPLPGVPGSGGPDFGGPDLGGPLPGGPGSGGGKRPWFGPRRFGWGYRPQTWQGWLVTALMVAVIVTAGTAWKGRPWFPVVVIAVVAVPFVISAAQRLRR